MNKYVVQIMKLLFQECGVKGNFHNHKATEYEEDKGLTKFAEFPWQVVFN